MRYSWRQNSRDKTSPLTTRWIQRPSFWQKASDCSLTSHYVSCAKNSTLRQLQYLVAALLCTVGRTQRLCDELQLIYVNGRLKSKDDSKIRKRTRDDFPSHSKGYSWTPLSFSLHNRRGILTTLSREHQTVLFVAILLIRIFFVASSAKPHKYLKWNIIQLRKRVYTSHDARAIRNNQCVHSTQLLRDVLP